MIICTPNTNLKRNYDGRVYYPQPANHGLTLGLEYDRPDRVDVALVRNLPITLIFLSAADIAQVLHIYICIYMYMCVCVYINKYIYIYILIYMFIHLYNRPDRVDVALLRNLPITLIFLSAADIAQVYMCVCVCVCVCVYAIHSLI